MTSRNFLSIGLSALVVSGPLMAGAAGTAMLAHATTLSSDSDARKAARDAEEAREQLGKNKAERAVRYAESAVENAPRNGEYRALLGQTYLMSGRFQSAQQALTDALSLDPGNGTVALHLALSQIANGDWAGARQTLETHSNTIPAGDRGLAMALAGDPVGAVEVLLPAARQPGATAKVRQNLALALALSGRWQDAKALAAIDVPPDQLDRRMTEWASFSRPTNAYDQVASLLGVRAVQDPGQPQQLALAETMQPVAAAAQTVDPVDAYMPGDGASVAAVPAADIRPAAPAPARNGVVFGPSQEVVQALPGNYSVASAATPAPSARPAVTAPNRAPGNYFVQLGAYSSEANARAAWRRASSRHAMLSNETPSQAKIANRRGTFYRLSVGGYSRAEANAMCRELRSSGGRCFVRAKAGDETASWLRGDTQVASR
ncbi:SPOR domain-containing protein [Stakelama tenebrarum]|uniref:Tetratricopeptide repeat protein n=1 Tax=Stakelama tenebrarum TaxID=2711215 RepID=A0A6G6Y8V0_9SPHN|nr:tetratricopeptide repeat protein [Sphingosinithalassobacter tenebrarum]QIG80996.1 tetratricopeptide repeat protein [Sphingosinithalassobacter tenebrarum]